MDINDLRNEIDKIDKEIVALFERRMAVSKDIGQYKKSKGLPLYDQEREQNALQSRIEMLGNKQFEPYLKQLFTTLMELSKGYQFQTTSEKNIVLIGIMGSGKSSKGRLLASRLGMHYVDVDDEIEKEQGMSISDIFAKKGSFEFRKLESNKIEEISKKKRHVISTGGGVVLSDSNMNRLKENAIVVFLNRDIDEIVRTIDIANRPLLEAAGASKLYEIFKDRLPLYRKWCDIEITEENKSVEDSVNEIIKRVFLV
jgi:shikimate kinase